MKTYLRREHQQQFTKFQGSKTNTYAPKDLDELILNVSIVVYFNFVYFKISEIKVYYRINADFPKSRLTLRSIKCVYSFSTYQSYGLVRHCDID